MREHPILFSAPMVQAILAGRKTQTRRILKPQPAEWQAQVIDITKPFYDADQGGWGQIRTDWSTPSHDMPRGQPEREVWVPLKGLRWAVGDRLWVRETWARTTNVNDQQNWPGRDHKKCDANAYEVAIYRADGDWTWCDGDGFRTEQSFWKPSIHMPRWASRITLTVTDVRVQRLHEISGDDAIAEGIPLADHKCGCERCAQTSQLCPATASSVALAYGELWDRIHGDGAWDKNPIVVALTFSRP